MAVVYWIRKGEHSDIMSEGYIGVTKKSAIERFTEHGYEVSGGSQYPVHRAMRKYGSSIILETISEGTIDYCYSLEGELRSSQGLGWNLAVGGQVSPMQGRKHTAEVLADLRIKQAGENNGFYGKTHTAEVVEAQRQRRLGQVASEQTKALLSEVRTGDGNAFFGRTHSDETKRKIRDARLAFSDEKKLALSQVKPMLGRKASDATKEKLRASHIGRVYPKRTWKPWEHPRANKPLWARADEVYSEYLSNGEVTSYTLAKTMGVARQPIATIHAKLLEGWIPITDDAWLQFKECIIT